MAPDFGEDRIVRLSPSARAVTERPTLAPLPAELAIPKIRGPISPELVLVDPVLGLAARAALPERPWPEAPRSAPEGRTARRSDPDVARLQQMIRNERRAILAHDPGTRLGSDPENLHQLRVATRRIRAFLRVARSHVDPDWADETRRQLGELGRSLGPVRDLDVLLENLRREVSALDDAEQPAAEALLAQLEESRNLLHDELVEALDAPAYAEILDRLHRPIRPAAEPPRRSLAQLAEREVKRLAKRVDRLGAAPADEALHRLRIHVKRVRYTLELAAPDADKRTKRMIRAAKRLQDLLGEHQDAVVAEERIRGLAAESDSRVAFVAGRLAERQSQRRRRLRKKFPKTWRRLRRASHRM